MKTDTLPASAPRIVSRQDWLVARLAHLQQEKKLTRQREELRRQRSELPWVKLDQNYVFTGPNGRVTMADLFEGRSQLIVYHFMFGADWGEGCAHCSFVADHFDGARVHLNAKDVSFTAISHAPWPEIAPFRQRMGWKFPWVSSAGTSFNTDYHVSFTPEQIASGKVPYNYAERPFPVEEAPGFSVFAKNAEGEVFHTFSSYGRGIEVLMGTYHFLDLVPKGRNESADTPMDWVRYHDRYETAGASA
jgi:predicted dithiol-disulfide oxidoreductase (DUF899 family)